MGAKFESRWKEGFTIVKKLSDDAYLVSDGKKTIRVNKKHLKKIFFLGESDVEPLLAL
ncbi:hypothetical protein GVAV_002560 [Gurleya vavrai]